MMKLEPIINAKLKKFRLDYALETEQDGEAFERFANQVILTNHQPDAFNFDGSLLDAICIGGRDDMGLDGICIKLNGVLVHSPQEAKDILSVNKRADIEFIFIQSKYKDKFESGEYAKFINGAFDFLGPQHYQPHNSQIDVWLKIKDYLLSDGVMMAWDHNPHIRLYYVVMGVWNNSPHIIAISDKFRDDITKLNLYGEVNLRYIDSSAFKRICDENENSFSAVLNIIDTFSLTAVEKVENSIIILFEAAELVKMISTEDGIVRKNLFTDNVRDFQGDTTINLEILQTISNSPESFVLFNNGITIVCDSVISGNRKITIRNPQIVNGCQTCNVIFSAFKNSVNISKVVLTAKIISTDSQDITNNIVRGTNRQNIVYDEAFEITRAFHKELEEFFLALAGGNPDNKLFYERRSKQFAGNPTIAPFQKVNFRIIIQSFVSIFLNAPNEGHRHESKLLLEYKNKIFVDTQSKYPYYTAARIANFVEYMVRKGVIPKELATYKMQIALLFKHSIGGYSPSINSEHEIDDYCEKVLDILNNKASAREQMELTVNLFREKMAGWIKLKGESYKYGIKDSVEFSGFLMQSSLASPGSSSNKNLKNRGTVIKISRDRNDALYGFISKDLDDVFFHSADNPSLPFENLLNHEVLYTLSKNSVNGRDKAINVTLLS
jgi:hypothetical protein